MTLAINQRDRTRIQISRPSHKKARRENKAVRVLDLCCGLGGLSIAARRIGMTILAGIDLDPHALKTFSRNFPEATSIEGSIRSDKVLDDCGKLLHQDENDSPFVVVSGPPCQGFSIAGPRKAGDPRNRVLIDAARAIVKMQPNCALIENVSMILAPAHDDRLTKLKGILADGGFHVLRILLDASEFGTPQKRKRAFFLITRQPLDEKRCLKELEAYKSLSKGTEETFKDLPKAAIRPDHYDDEIEYGSINNHLAMQHSRRVMTKISKIQPGTGPMSYRRLHPTRVSNTLFSGHRAPPAHFKESRSITVREAARLQGIPDDFRIYGSFGSQMGQVTNAVPPALGEAVLRVLLQLAVLPNERHG
jgi:DNA (cytosine-5)-methyltransferase 1